MTFEGLAAVRLVALPRFAGVLTGDRALAEDAPAPIWPSSGSPLPPGYPQRQLPALPHRDDGPASRS